MDRLGSDLRGALRGLGVPDAGALADVTRVWPAAVGPAIARAAWPKRIARDGTLHVNTASAAWANELSLLAAEVSAKLAAELGEAAPASLRFAVGPVPEPDAPEPERSPPPAIRPSADDLAVAGEVASAIDDPELRETVRRAAAASLARRHSDPPV